MKRILSVFALALAIPVWAAPQDFVKKPPPGVNIDPGIKHTGPKHPDARMPFVNPTPTRTPTPQQRQKQARLRARLKAQPRAQKQKAQKPKMKGKAGPNAR